MVIQFRPGPLRLAALPPHPIACARIHLRPLSSFVPQKCTLIAPRTFHCRPPPSFTTSLILGSRSLSLGSIFNGFKVTPAPSPTVVAHITRLEAEANVYPHDVAKQLALFNALIETNLKASYDLVINRWERMCEFDSTSPLLRSEEAFQAYITCLVRTGLDSSVQAAARRRDSLLASTATAAAAASTAPGSEEVNASSAAIASTPASDAPAAEPTSQPQPTATPAPKSSQEIVMTVLAGRTGSQAKAPFDTDAAKLASTLETMGPLQVSVVERKGSWIPRIIRHVLTLLTVSSVFLVILSVFLENTGFAKNGPRMSEYEPSEENTVKFSDVHGVDEVKDELKDIVEFLKDPDSFATLGGKLPKGVLLTGPPGTGKTMLARAVAGEAGVPFFFASGSEFEEMFVGVGAKRVRELFAAARKKEPAIIFIDELDAVGGKRNSRDQQYMKQTLNQLLVEMDGFAQSHGVIVIAATNFPQSLDPALVRPGRFDRHVAVPLPDILGRVQIIKHHMKGVRISPDVDPKILARGTPGFSGADLQNMVNLAAIQASKERATDVTLKHMEWAKDRIVMGAERRSAFISEKDKLSTAYHEGGHTLVALYTDGAMPLHKVTCIRRGHALGYTAMLPEDDVVSQSYKQMIAAMDVSMGGRVAEALIYGHDNISSGASSDIRSATQTATRMVKEWGFSSLGPVFFSGDHKPSPARALQIDDEISKLIKDSEARATALLTSKITELHRLAHALVEHETMDADEVRKAIKGEPITKLDDILKEVEKPESVEGK
ncbi:ATP-dependent metallopeptidase Hfl [Hymenopellis radicata]|nr:ATP-dependent metallopeptidase Hfl [Hymenopellis radicata]